MKFLRFSYWGMLKEILKLMEVQMAAIDDLKASVVTIQAAVDVAVAKLATLEAGNGVNDAAIAQAAVDITAASTKLGAA